MKKLRYGIIGCGNIGRVHLGAINQGKQISCAGICDIVPEHAERMNGEFGGEIHVFQDAEKMCQSQEIDAVILAVPNYQHFPMFALAAKNGKHILCEKPMALHIAEAERMVETAHKYNVKVQMGFCTRFDPYADAMLLHIQAGDIGNVYFARADVLRQRGAPMGWFGNVTKSGGGALIDIGVHYIDLCWYLMGKPVPVSCKALNYREIKNRYPKNVEIYKAYEQDETYNVEDSSHGLITFDNGAGLMYQAAWTLNGLDVDERVELYGNKGGFVKNPCRMIREEASGMTVTEISALWGDCYTRQLEAFARVVLDGEICRSPVEDGLIVQRMLDGLYRSAESGREVRL